ncbi:hypothetical protein HFP89_06365 [Wenzhouxiangella sp. XN79A]|uniref:hypothetical protein n=1 Tax=Wenzhouxiangella sp. XN79A TaxID=2724193 RepID=UPI00144AD669|nr:hypothetical protein [Wenzhouxiangella sp. XN79A]NKI34786.1 hypothetical protein [Wenzhouxiangella sp. XN79A]
MYRPVHLFRVARRGLADMLPALRQAFNDQRDDDRLDRVFGPWPRTTLLAGTVLGVVGGRALQSILGGFALFDFIHLGAVLFAVAYALAYRRYLFGDPSASEADFPWLAAALIPPGIALVLVAFVERTLGGVDAVAGAPEWTSIGTLLDAMADSLAVAAGLTIAVAALCYSRAWGEAVKTLVRRLIVFKIIVWVMVLLFVEIGFVGPILERAIEGLLGIDVPDWFGDVADQITYAALMTTIYLAIIGGTWTACRRSFGALLRDGEVDVVETLVTMAETPEKRREKARVARAATSDKDPGARD